METIDLVCGIASAVIPGLGQAIKGHVLKGLVVFFLFVLSCLLILVLIGLIVAPIVWFWNIYDAVKIEEAK